MLSQPCSMSQIGIQGGEAHNCSKFPIIPYRLWLNCGPTLTDTISTWDAFWSGIERWRSKICKSHLSVFAKGWVAVGQPPPTKWHLAREQAYQSFQVSLPATLPVEYGGANHHMHGPQRAVQVAWWTKMPSWENQGILIRVRKKTKKVKE